MTAFNVVRFKVKPGSAEQFIEAHRAMRPEFKGYISGNMVRTGDRTFCFVGEWRNFQSIVDARPEMVSMLDRIRHLLEDLGAELGMTDPVSGESVLRLGPPQKVAKKKTAKSRRPAKRASSRKTGAGTKRKGTAKRKTARKR